MSSPAATHISPWLPSCSRGVGVVMPGVTGGKRVGGREKAAPTQAACLLEASVTSCLSLRPSGPRACRSAAVDLLSTQNVLWPSWFSVTSIFFFFRSFKNI